jgi:hypothetical protein
VSSRAAEFWQRASARGKDLERAIAGAFPELRRVSVSLGSRSGVSPDGREVSVHAFGVNLYVSTDERPDASLSLDVTVQDLEVASEVERALSRIPTGRCSE